MHESANEHLAQIERLIRSRKPAHILDVGMGRGNYGWFLRNVCEYRGTLTSIDVWAPYVEGPDALAGGNRSYYDRIVVGDIRESEQIVAQCRPDMVFAFDVIEHMPRDEGVNVIRMLQRNSKGVLVSVPIVPYAQGQIHGNPYEEHRYDWITSEMMALGSECLHRGVATGLFEFPCGAPDCHVTVMLNTVREESAASGITPLKALADDLRSQLSGSIKFEMIAVDGLFQHRQAAFIGHDYPFRILHIPPRDCAMVRERRCAISAYKNSGLAHARGELVLTVDDCAVLDPKYVERVWRAWAERRECLSALYYAIDSKKDIDDSRVIYLDDSGRCVGPRFGNIAEPPMYGFAAIPIEAAIAVNGYDELFDGSQGLEDMDMGVRLQQAGYKISLDRVHRVALLPQREWSEQVFGDRLADPTRNRINDTCVKCCQSTFRIQRTRNLVRANEISWGVPEWAQVAPRCYLLNTESRCNLNGHLCPYVGTCSDREHPGLDALRGDQPQFDLRALRTAAGVN